MEDPTILNSTSTGRLVGILLLLQLATALTLPFILAAPITVGSPAFLAAGAEHEWQVRWSVILSFVGSALTVYIGVIAGQVFSRYSKTVATVFLVSCVVSCVLDLVHAGTIMTLLSMSNKFVASGAADTSAYEVVGAAASFARRSAHVVQLLAIGAWMSLFYISMYRFRLLPRVLSGIGVLGVLLQFTGVTLMMLLGFRLVGEMAMPLLPIQITVGVWLIVKGFKKY